MRTLHSLVVLFILAHRVPAGSPLGRIGGFFEDILARRRMITIRKPVPYLRPEWLHLQPEKSRLVLGVKSSDSYCRYTLSIYDPAFALLKPSPKPVVDLGMTGAETALSDPCPSFKNVWDTPEDLPAYTGTATITLVDDQITVSCSSKETTVEVATYTSPSLDVKSIGYNELEPGVIYSLTASGRPHLRIHPIGFAQVDSGSK